MRFSNSATYKQKATRKCGLTTDEITAVITTHLLGTVDICN